MAGKQIAGDGLPTNLAGMSKNQLYDIMSQMKGWKTIGMRSPLMGSPLGPVKSARLPPQSSSFTLLIQQVSKEGRREDAGAQIMLGMVQSPQAISNVQPAASLPQQSVQPVQQPNIQAAPSLPGQIGSQDQTSISRAQNPIRKQQENQPVMPVSSTSVPPSNIPPQSLASHPTLSVQQPRGHLTAQATPVSLPQPSQAFNMPPIPIHSASHPSSHLQTPMPISDQMQQPVQTSTIPHMMLQPPMPPQPRPALAPAFPYQVHPPQMGVNTAFQHSGAPQLHHPQHMFHPGAKAPLSMGPSFLQGQPPLPSQAPPQSMYQGGSSHLGAEFSQVGSSTQGERGSSWMPGPPDISTAPQLSAPQPFAPAPIGVGNQPPHPPPVNSLGLTLVSANVKLTPDMEKLLLQQVMSLTQEQIHLLPPEQRNQVLQLQQMLRK
ncbi:hypothetical protein RJ640_021598 [Escallonia rubra]|uniref:Transcription termination and cleavage factor C-terminal domain-containing protein n=1 Tax=Escallonia rubra TaxID=112253 RepID=A0AA88RDN7_9ASTE|nr:hypothetical protein RJ640_021598 [Escallonia rubra]